jgi:hypothetical protein
MSPHLHVDTLIRPPSISYTCNCDSEHRKQKLSLCLIKHHVMNTYGGAVAQLHAWLTSAQDESDWSLALSLGKRTPDVQ